MEDKVLQFIKDYTKENGYPPTYRDIGDGCELKSTSSVTWYLDKLKRAGRITQKRNSPRSIKVLE